MRKAKKLLMPTKLIAFDDLKPGERFYKLETSGKKSSPYFKIKDAWDGEGVLVNAVEMRSGTPCLVGYSERVMADSRRLRG